MLKKFYLPYRKWLSMINIVLNQKKNQNAKKKEESYCVGCRKKTKHKNIKGIALENKMRPQKSMCVDCNSKKSTFKNE